MFTGPDRVRKLQRLQAFEHALGVGPLDRHRLDARELPAPALLALCRQSPAAGLARLVILDEAQRLPSDAVEGLRAHIAQIQAVACVVLLVEADVPARHPLTAWLREPSRGSCTIEQFLFRDGPAARPFALIEALGQRNLVEAVEAVRDQLASGRDAVEIFGQLAWLVQRWVTVKRLAQAGCAGERMAETTGMRLWQVTRIQREVAERPLAELDHLLTRCWALERAAKRGAAVPELAVEQLVAELCVPALSALPAAEQRQAGVPETCLPSPAGDRQTGQAGAPEPVRGTSRGRTATTASS